MDRQAEIRGRIQGVVNHMLLEEGKNRAFVVASERPLADVEFDSLAFAVLFARLDEEFGIDPFQETMIDTFPHTFGDLFAHYNKHLADEVVG